MPVDRGIGESEPPGSQAPNSAAPSPGAVRFELERVLSSPTFTLSQQLCRFLRFVVEAELDGRSGELKEYTLGTQVIRRNPEFDPRIDPIVRTEARRLRQKLAEYYQNEGKGDEVEILLPKGSYRAVFRSRPQPVADQPKPPARFAVGAKAWVAAALVAAVGTAVWWARREPAVKPPAIAVLPIENLSPNPGEEYFSDGLTDALITNLARFRGLSVISRTSVMQYKKTTKSVPEIGRDLKVDYLVEGSVTRAGDRVRLTAQLIATSTDRHLWAESYERDARDILTLQRELARSIADQVHIRTAPEEGGRVSSVSLEAYDLYLRGRFNWHTRETARLEKSLDDFRQAVGRSPDFALAYAGLADTYSVLGSRFQNKDYVAQACEAARKALQIDPNLGEVHVSLDACEDDWDWSPREAHFRKALELSPSYSTAHQWYAKLLMSMGRGQEALAEARRAVELDPLSPSPHTGLCVTLYLTRQYDKAIEQCQQTLDVFPGHFEIFCGLGFALSEKGMHRQAIAVLERAMTQMPGFPPVATILAHARARSGDARDAHRLRQEFAARTGLPPILLATLYMDTGDPDRAVEWLEKAIDHRSLGSEDIKVQPLFDSLHSHPRWRSLLRKMNLAY